MKNYVCPHCGAEDSTTCEKLKDISHRPSGAYSWRELDRARKVGCRVAYYHDLYIRTGSYDSPDD